MVAMESLSMLDLTREWRFEDLELLSDELCKFVEIVDGVLTVSPSPGLRHGVAIDDVQELLRSFAPVEIRVMSAGLGVRFSRSYLVPDLIVVPRTIDRYLDRGYLEPGQILLAVEVVSPTSQTRDRVTKKAQYAGIGIPSYWRVELEPVTLTAYRLVGAEYDEIGTWGAGETARLTAPFDVAVDIDRITPG